jgi:hypothetical protein
MPPRFVTHSLVHATGRIPGLRRVPLVTLLSIAELGVMARIHLQRLTPYERRRLFVLIRSARGRRNNLTPAEREEFSDLVAELEPRLLAAEAVQRLSPVPVPKRLVAGRRRRGRPPR